MLLYDVFYYAANGTAYKGFDRDMPWTTVVWSSEIHGRLPVRAVCKNGEHTTTWLVNGQVVEAPEWAAK